MGKIGNVSAAQNHAPAGGKVSDNSGDNTLYKEKLVFSASELGLNGKRPATIVLTERQVETKIFQKYGFNPNNRVQNELLKLRFDTKKSPFEEIDWGKGQFAARLTSGGQYEITVNLREKTLEALSGRLINAPATSRTTAIADPNAATASRIGINSADYRRLQIENKLSPSLEGLTAEQKELVADLTQVGLSVIGIFDPTGIADGADAVISLGRGDYWGAGISALGIIPYLGDLAKIGKLPKLLKVVENVVSMAKADARFAKVVTPLLKGLKNAIDNLPIHKLPNWAKEPIEKLSSKIDEFFGIRKITKPALTPGGQKAVTLDTLKHIFHGEVKTGRNGARRSVGFHYEGAEMQAMKGTKPATITRQPDANGIYEAVVDIEGTRKRLPSSFFPKNWTKNDVVNAVNDAYTNGKSVAGKPANYIEGKSSSGVWVGMYLNPGKTIATAFPLYGR